MNNKLKSNITYAPTRESTTSGDCFQTFNRTIDPTIRELEQQLQAYKDKEEKLRKYLEELKSICLYNVPKDKYVMILNYTCDILQILNDKE